MHVLVLGGSGFIGRHVAAALAAAGHRVDAFQRGDGPLPPAVARLTGDRDLALPAGRWDACVDTCAYRPRQVRAAAALDVGHHLFVSAVRVYADPPAGPVTEDFPLVEPLDDAPELDNDTYGRLKRGCELALPAGASVLRPQVVVGPGDPSGRVAHWLARPEGPFPGDGSDALQVVDVRDLARFAVTLLERGTRGTFNVAGPRVTWRAFVAGLGHTNPRWAPPGDGPPPPLYRPPGHPLAALMHVSSARAQAAGLVLTPADETFAALRQA